VGRQFTVCTAAIVALAQHCGAEEKNPPAMKTGG